MTYHNAFLQDSRLIDSVGKGNAHMLWALALYLEEPNTETLAAAALTDGPDDKKLDFVYLDLANQKIILAQGYYAAAANKDTAPANKASDLNTGAAWLVSGNLDQVPVAIRPAITGCRNALADGDVDTIELLYVHNLPESTNVTRELQTAAQHLKLALAIPTLAVVGRELGTFAIENLFLAQDSQIAVKEEVACPAKIEFEEEGPNWHAVILNVPGAWLKDLFQRHGDALFSANYRGFLGITKRKRINTSIMTTAKDSPENFWVFNNGITLLTLGLTKEGRSTHLSGISIINGAQTTGSIGMLPSDVSGLAGVKVLCRAIICSDPETISNIIQFNNTQNEITTWDRYSNDLEQMRIEAEFSELGFVYYRKRGFRPLSGQIGIEDVAQPLTSFHGKYKDAYSGKNRVFERRQLYKLAFEGKKARHILFVHTLALAIDDLVLQLKKKSSDGTIIEIEERQLRLLRHLRFKQFFIALMSKVLDNILGFNCDRETVAFLPHTVRSASSSIVPLTAAWAPIVETVLSLSSAHLDSTTFSDLIADEDAVDQTARSVGALIYATRSNLPLHGFPPLVSSS